MPELNPMEVFRKRINQFEYNLSYNDLYEKFRDYIQFVANFYKKIGLDYYDVENQCLLLFYDNYHKYDNDKSLRRYVNSQLRDYCRQEMKERHLSYGINPENYNI
jgi:hypothetical protein